MIQFRFLAISIIFICTSFNTKAFEDLLEIEHFGGNPGNLKMFIHIPKTMAHDAVNIPMVVALHGCSQSAETIAKESGWNELADKYRFIVIYPEQKRANNVSNCFNWFKEKDIQGNEGESQSILNMINYMIREKSIDAKNVSIYGLSAGAAMSVALLANKPCTFKNGAIFAGGPYGYVHNGISGYKLMMNPPDKTPEEWHALLPNSASECVPKLIIAHGTKDKVVDFRNAAELIDQWSSLSILEKPKVELKFEGNENMNRHRYFDNQGVTKIVFYEGLGLGHALPINPGDGLFEGGETGKYSIDFDFFSTYYIVQDFGLIRTE